MFLSQIFPAAELKYSYGRNHFSLVTTSTPLRSCCMTSRVGHNLNNSLFFSYDFESSDILTMTDLWFSQQLTMKRITALLVIEDLPYLPWITFSISCISQTA